ncbi:MobA/MobL family protein [Bradyrhizobium sp.]|uniref:MobA/MobL family protein n=1 Tax=Bradyrhizobium sp. TaxID=376 RepID=UPI002736FB98|nr:MobA/MobL family protein [Bradyrhizobium sp.]MDP3078701.1 MobA/MobL family protein [Bradyrhizobium sp.]
MASASGFYRFEHSYLSRAGNKTRGKSGRFHLSSIASYISNSNKACDVLAVNLSTERGELYSQMNKHSASVTRANGRIAETFIISFDARMSDEHQREALNNFLMAATFNGQTRATAYRHNDHEHNPHAHVILIDTDENGEPVGHFGRSGSFRREHSPVKGNPTTWLRQVWEDECNAVLEAHEYDFRIDRRSNLERGLDEAGKPRGFEVSQKDPKQGQQVLTDHTERPLELVPEAAPECPPMPVDAQEAEPYPDDLSDEDTMAKLPVRESVIAASYFHNELKELRHLQAKFDTAEKSVLAAEREFKVAEGQAFDAWSAKDQADKQLYVAQERLAVFQKDNGKLRGIGFKLGPLEWKSKTRTYAEQALSTKAGCEAELDRCERLQQSTQAQVTRWENAKAEAETKQASTKAELDMMVSRWGQSATREDAEKVLEHSARSYMDNIADRDEATGEAKEDPFLILEDLYETGQISKAQYIDALEIVGAHDRIAELQAGEDEGEDPGPF